MEKNIIKQQYLEGDEYYSNKTNKKTIVLHHTAGSHRPDWVISSWDRDRTKGGRPLRVATQFVIPIGKIRFDERGDAIGAGFSVYHVQNGVFVELK